MLCPKCNSDMVKRKSSRGEFYGCSKYPQCTGKLPFQQTAGEILNTAESPTISPVSANSRDDDIHLQVCLKIASEQIAAKGGTDNPKFISDLAKKLKKEVWG